MQKLTCIVDLVALPQYLLQKGGSSMNAAASSAFCVGVLLSIGNPCPSEIVLVSTPQTKLSSFLHVGGASTVKKKINGVIAI
jgi:hypothetical protein